MWLKTPRTLQLCYKEHCVTAERELTFVEISTRFLSFLDILRRRLALLLVALPLLCNVHELQIICYTWVQILSSLTKPFVFRMAIFIFTMNWRIFLNEAFLPIAEHCSPEIHAFLCHFFLILLPWQKWALVLKHTAI